MLTIRNEQIAALSQARDERFIEETLLALPSVFPGDPRVDDHEAMRPVIREGIKRAIAYGITGAREVMLYVFLFHELGPGFEACDKTRWIGRILEDSELAPRAKLDLIYTRLKLASHDVGAA